MWRIIVRRIIIAFSFLAISNPAFTQNTDSNIRQKQKPDHYFTPQESKIEGIGVIADLKACYLLLPDHNTYFFLVEIKLINNTDTLFESVTYSCTTSINIVHDSRKIKDCMFPCAGNQVTLLRLRPKEEFTIPILLQAEDDHELFSDPVKFGFAVVSPKNIDFYDVRDRLMEMRNHNENVIWSEEIYLHPVNQDPVFEIKTVVNDTTYIKHKNY